MPPATVRGIAELQAYAAARVTAGDSIGDVCSLTESLLRSGLATEAELEQAVLGIGTNADSFDPLLQRAVDHAIAYLARFGIAAPQRSPYRRHALALWRGACNLEATGYDCLNLYPMRQWSDAATRRLVASALRDLPGPVWPCIFAADLARSSYYMDEAMSILSAAAKGSAEPDYDALWQIAIESLEYEEWPGDNGAVEARILGIGGREDFEFCARGQINLLRDHQQFFRAPPTGRLRPRVMRQVQAWAQRTRRLGRALRKDYSTELQSIESADYRPWHEQLILVTGRLQGGHIDAYFKMTDGGNGEIPGLQWYMDESGRSVQLALIVALASTAIFQDLQRSLT